MNPETESLKLLKALHWNDQKPRFSSTKAARKLKKAKRLNKRIGRQRQN